ncbi:MAG: anti-sigma factor [Acidimicrobiales bacterium]|nr:anti-sigma factor [Acidimicrobiales bacterium]
MSGDRDGLGVSLTDVERLHAIAARLDDEDFARVDPPADLWRRISARLDDEVSAGGSAGPGNGAPAADPTATASASDDTARLRTLVVQVDDEDHARVDPPADLWGRIAASVEADPVPAAVTVAVAPTSSPPPVSAPVVPLDAHRRRRHRRVLAAVAAVVVVVAVTGAVLLQGGSSTDDEPQLVASTELEPLEPVGGATAEVRLVRQDDHLQLELDARDMAAAPDGQHYELWLLDPDSESAEPVSLGAMTGSTSVPVPAGVDPDHYAVVDVSLQEQGQTEHSGHSLLRGTLA